MSEKKNGAESPQEIRINKYLAEAGFCSRREADRLIEAGRVSIALPGQERVPVLTGTRISTGTVVYVDNVAVQPEEQKVLLLFHKPTGVVCSTKQQRSEMTVTEYLNYQIRIYPVGRLDKDSEGLLLLTNQGDLVNRIMKAAEHHQKEYLVTVDCPVTEEFLRGMRGGVPILDTVTRQCPVEKTGKYSFRIILTQGLNRQIRRMCEYFGYRVTRLVRIRIMNLTLEGLSAGQYRTITATEREELERLLNSPHKERTIDAGGHYGRDKNAHERTGRASKPGRKGVLPGRPGDHEQSRVRSSVRRASGTGKNNRHRAGQ